MRFCENETVDVYEATGNDLAVLLRDAADTVDTHEGYSAIEVSYQIEDNYYVVTVYNHG